MNLSISGGDSKLKMASILMELYGFDLESVDSSIISLIKPDLPVNIRVLVKSPGDEARDESEFDVIFTSDGCWVTLDKDTNLWALSRGFKRYGQDNQKDQGRT